MLPPDEYAIIRPLDAVVQFAHDWGVERKIVIRLIAALALASMIVFNFMRSADNPVLASVGVAILSIVLVAYTWMEEFKSSFRGYNTTQLFTRQSLLGWFRFAVFAALFIPQFSSDPAHHIDNIFWLLWLYSFYTIKPVEPPKHHWRQLIPSAFKTAPGTA